MPAKAKQGQKVGGTNWLINTFSGEFKHLNWFTSEKIRQQKKQKTKRVYFGNSLSAYTKEYCQYNICLKIILIFTIIVPFNPPYYNTSIYFSW